MGSTRRMILKPIWIKAAHRHDPLVFLFLFGIQSSFFTFFLRLTIHNLHTAKIHLWTTPKINELPFHLKKQQLCHCQFFVREKIARIVWMSFFLPLRISSGLHLFCLEKMRWKWNQENNISSMSFFKTKMKIYFDKFFNWTATSRKSKLALRKP